MTDLASCWRLFVCWCSLPGGHSWPAVAVHGWWSRGGGAKSRGPVILRWAHREQTFHVRSVCGVWFCVTVRSRMLCWHQGQVCVCGAHCVLSLPPCVRVRVRVWQRNICAYAVVIVVKMAEGETEKEYDTRKAIGELRERFQGLTTTLKESSQSPLEASLHFCQEFCQVSPFSCCSSRGSLQPLWLPGRGCASTFAITM